MNSLKKNNIIKFTGISLAKNSIYEEKILKQFDIIQDDANLLSVKFQKYKNFKIYGRSPYANGILTGSLMRKFSQDDHRSGWLNDSGRKKIISKSLIKLKNLSDINLKELAFFFVNSNKHISKNIFGIKSKKHIDDINMMLAKKIPKNIFELSEKIYDLNQNMFNINKKNIKYLF